ncbi:hypothetical protein [Weissella minor]|uniref:Uncharacterized protein n=1 Tax=Weissella minor TaxID=1620 RepID=A0A0R2JQM4_9LACO|nr:hypothetical protein [Weissella minor]KRN77701.1 hypothetical protein IV67_GL001401 [Weissella minor]
MTNSSIDFTQILDELRTGVKSEFTLEAENFPEFFEVWRSYPYQNAIVGEAHQGGRIIYRKSDEDNA